MSPKIPLTLFFFGHLLLVMGPVLICNLNTQRDSIGGKFVSGWGTDPFPVFPLNVGTTLVLDVYIPWLAAIVSVSHAYVSPVVPGRHCFPAIFPLPLTPKNLWVSSSLIPEGNDLMKTPHLRSKILMVSFSAHFLLKVPDLLIAFLNSWKLILFMKNLIFTFVPS